MPRKPRIDAPGLLYHVVARGIERREIFNDDKDRKMFLSRLQEVLEDTNTVVYAFALIPNHFHLLLRRTTTPISTVMRRLLTSYAIYFNKRHKRSGHLFQNRYKAIICQDDPYLLELIRYIHLNPQRAGITKTLEELRNYPFCGHTYVMGKRKCDWYNAQNVLSHFGSTERRAKASYFKFITDGLSMGKRADLTGGGLKRSLGYPKHYPKTKIAFDDRVLGEGGFVEQLLLPKKESSDINKNHEFDQLIDNILTEYDISRAQLLGKGRTKQEIKARDYLVREAIETLGMPGSEIARRLSISRSAVTKIYKRSKFAKSTNVP